jgi:hypothetical protein
MTTLFGDHCKQTITWMLRHWEPTLRRRRFSAMRMLDFVPQQLPLILTSLSRKASPH